MSWIEKLPSGRYRAKYRDVAGHQHSKTFPTRGEAKSFLTNVGADLQRGEWIDPRAGALRFADWSERWLAARVVRPTTLHADLGRLRNHVLPEFGRVALRDIGPLLVGSWVARLTDRLSPKTVRHCHALLSIMLADAVTEGLIASNPCRGSRLPPASPKPAMFLSGAEVDRLVEEVMPHYQPLVMVAASTGMRWGELAGLKRERVDLLRRRLRVVETLVEVNGALSFGPPKTPRSTREISLPRQAVDALSVAMANPHPALVFVTEHGDPLRRNNFRRRVWEPSVRRAELLGLRFHDLRHTHVALLIAAGVPVKAIQERLGHRSIVTTMDRYGHLLRSVDDHLVAALETHLIRRPDERAG